MGCRTYGKGRVSHLSVHVLLSHARAMKTGVMLLVLAFTACQHGTPRATSAPSRGISPTPSTIVKELSARSRIPASELRPLLADCSRTQLSMNICAFRDFVASDLELDAAISTKRESAPPQCRADIHRMHAAWQAGRNKACNRETEADKGGSMYPLLLMSCKAVATRERLTFVKHADLCARER